MSSPLDRRQADLDWLYGNERPSVDRAQEFDASELAELERRRAAAASTGARAAAEASTPNPPADPQRVVHVETELGDVKPRERLIAPTPPRQDAARPGTAGPDAAGGRLGRLRRARPAADGVPPRAGAPGAGASRSGRGRRRPHWLRWLLVALVAWVVWLLVVPVIGLSRSPQVTDQPSGDRPAQEPGTATLLIGSDKRTGLTAEQQKALGTGGDSITGERTDTMLLLYQPASGKPVLVSLPRDTYAEIPGHGHGKLNSAYGYGGPQLAVQSVENLTGLRIDNYLEVGFDGFANVVDAVGGVPVCLSKAMVDKNSHTNLPAGCQTLDGIKALGYVRMRYSDPEGDLGRVKRQRAVIAAIAKKVKSPMTFINPVRYWKLNMAAGSGLTRGQDTGLTELPGIASAFMDISGNAQQSLTVPVANPDYMVGGVSYVKWDTTRAKEMFGQMARGDTSNLAQYAK